MGRVRTKTVKKAARVIVEKYYSKLTLDFQVNKKITEEVATVPSKRLRNKIAGFTTHLMKRIQKGPVRGISLKLQEEERERRMEFVPDQSEAGALRALLTSYSAIPTPCHISLFGERMMRSFTGIWQVCKEVPRQIRVNFVR